MLNKVNRLHKHGSFTYVYRKGTVKTRGPIKITFVKSQGVPKAGVSVPNSVGKAVVRNKVRRRIRAILYECIGGMCGVQIIVSAKKGAEELEFSALRQTLISLLTANGLYEEKDNAVARD